MPLQNYAVTGSDGKTTTTTIISEMLKMPEWTDYLKVRASWAKVGNDTDPYKLAYAYSKYGSLVNGGTILEMQLPDELPLSDLKPEVPIHTKLA